MAQDTELDRERLDRNWTDLLQELRVAQTGVQVLAGFLLGCTAAYAFYRQQFPPLCSRAAGEAFEALASGGGGSVHGGGSEVELPFAEPLQYGGGGGRQQGARDADQRGEQHHVGQPGQTDPRPGRGEQLGVAGAQPVPPAQPPVGGGGAAEQQVADRGGQGVL